MSFISARSHRVVPHLSHSQACSPYRALSVEQWCRYVNTCSLELNILKLILHLCEVVLRFLLNGAAHRPTRPVGNSHNNSVTGTITQDLNTCLSALKGLTKSSLTLPIVGLLAQPGYSHKSSVSDSHGTLTRDPRGSPLNLAESYRVLSTFCLSLLPIAGLLAQPGYSHKSSAAGKSTTDPEARPQPWGVSLSFLASAANRPVRPTRHSHESSVAGIYRAPTEVFFTGPLAHSSILSDMLSRPETLARARSPVRYHWTLVTHPSLIKRLSSSNLSLLPFAGLLARLDFFLA